MSAASPGSVSGYIRTLDGRPVPGARVWLEQGDGKPPVETRSGTDGRFCLGSLPPACRLREDCDPLLAEADGFARTYALGVSVFAGADHDVGRLVLTPGRRYVGQVFGTDNRPQAGARVKVQSYRFTQGHTLAYNGPPWELTTDADGRFHTPPLPVGRMLVEVRVPGYRFAWIDRKILPGEDEEALEPVCLENDLPVTVRVVDDRGQPVAGASAFWSGAEGPAQTDPSGRLTIRGFGPNDRPFQLNVSAEDHVFEPRLVPVGAEVTVRLQRCGSILGLAVDADTGWPVRLTGVRLCHFRRLPDGTPVRQG